MLKIRKKWRPSLKSIIAVVVCTLVALPLIGILTARFTSDQFVHETERSLISQASIFAQTYANLYRASGLDPQEGYPLSKQQIAFYNQKFHPKIADLNTNSDLLSPPRPTPIPVIHSINPEYHQIGSQLTSISLAAQKTSLAGYHAVDIYGNIIGGVPDLKGNLSLVSEVSKALKGDMVSVLRVRNSNPKPFPLKSISRGTGFRVFVALPVIVDNHVVGAVHLVRTPNNLRRFIAHEQDQILLIGGFIILGAALVGFLLWRLVAGPINKLQLQGQRVATGESASLYPIDHYGTKELALMGQSILSMSQNLVNKNEDLQTYTAHVTHELKSPLTSIIGAVELLQGNAARMKPETRAKFYENIHEDGQRMTKLLDDLRVLAASELSKKPARANLSETLSKIKTEDIVIQLLSNKQFTVPLSSHDLSVILTQLIQNAKHHNATKIEIEAKDDWIIISDNGNGISSANARKIFDPFFTTNRDGGGTGMGLAIVKALLKTHQANIELVTHKLNTSFKITFTS